jgi:hypothetical protein
VYNGTTALLICKQTRPNSFQQTTYSTVITMQEATRYDITLDTGSSTDVDAKNNHYDQVLAMSQGIINASFEELFRSIPDTAEMYHEDRRTGRLDAVLDAPRIMINGSSTNATEVFYQLRYGSSALAHVLSLTHD